MDTEGRRYVLTLGPDKHPRSAPSSLVLFSTLGWTALFGRKPRVGIHRLSALQNSAFSLG